MTVPHLPSPTNNFSNYWKVTITITLQVQSVHFTVVIREKLKRLYHQAIVIAIVIAVG